MPGEGFLIRWTSVSNRVYAVLKATNLPPDGVFRPLESNIPATPVINVYTDKTDDAKTRFYRIKVE